MTDEEQLRQLNWDLQVATWKSDFEWMRRNLTPDFILIDTRGNVLDFEAWLKSMAEPQAPFEPTEVQIRLFGDTAIITARLMIGTVDLRYTDVWIRGADGWKYVAAHASRIAA